MHLDFDGDGVDVVSRGRECVVQTMVHCENCGWEGHEEVVSVNGVIQPVECPVCGSKVEEA